MTHSEIAGLMLIGGVALTLIVLFTAEAVSKRREAKRTPRPLPRGYELNTYATGSGDKREYHRIVPTFHGVSITEGYLIAADGYARAASLARADVFAHYDNNVDVKNV